MYDVEFTDTFAGEANYCWVRRAMVDGKTPRAVMRAAKRAMGLSGVRGKTEVYSGMVRFTPYRSATTMFVHYHDCGSDPCECEP